MSKVEILDPAQMRRGYLVNLLAATAAGALASGAIWVTFEGGVEPRLAWQIGAASVGVLATALTVGTIRKGRRMARAAAIARMLADVDRGEDAEPPKKGMAESIVEGLRRSAETVRAEASKTKEQPSDSVEGERERLRKAGFSEAEISQILVARESGQSGGLFGGQGVLSGVASNVKAVVDYLRGLVPSVRADLANMFDREASTAMRLSGTLSLTAKGVAAVVFGYFVYLEALQLRSQAYKSWAEACIERQKNAINFSTLDDLLSPNGPARKLDKECRGL